MFFPKLPRMPSTAHAASTRPRIPTDRRFITSEEPQAQAAHTGRYVAIDLETTSLDTSKARVIEIGAAVLEQGRISVQMNVLCDPCEPVSEEVQQLTGITDDMVSGQPHIAQLLPMLLDLIGDSPVVMHNAAYDLTVLQEEGRRIGVEVSPSAVYDTMLIARKRMPGMRSYALGALCEASGIQLRRAHRAAEDALATAHLFLRQLTSTEQ